MASIRACFSFDTTRFTASPQDPNPCTPPMMQNLGRKKEGLWGAASVRPLLGGLFQSLFCPHSLAALGPAQPFQNWLAREVGVTPAYVSMLVNGGRSPSGRIRRRMRKALGVTNSKELFKTEDKHERP